MSNNYNELERKRFLNRIFNVTGTVTGRLIPSQPNLQYLPQPKVTDNKQLADIERQRKNKAIQRRNATAFVGFSHI